MMKNKRVLMVVGGLILVLVLVAARVEPAKSENPSSLSQPPPHCHDPVIG
jgi:hypothetical protein